MPIPRGQVPPPPPPKKPKITAQDIMTMQKELIDAEKLRVQEQRELIQIQRELALKQLRQLDDNQGMDTNY